MKWVIRFDLYYGRHITRHGDESSTCEREFMDGHLPHILLCGGVAYSSSVVYVPSTLFDVPEETVKESNNLAITSNSLDVTTTISGLFLPSHHTPDVATIIGPRVPPIDVRAASFELDGCANHEDLVAPDPLEERSSVEIVHEVVPGNARENAKDLTSSDHTSPTSQHIASLDLTYDPLLREQRAAGVHEPCSLLPSWRSEPANVTRRKFGRKLGRRLGSRIRWTGLVWRRISRRKYTRGGSVVAERGTRRGRTSDGKRRMTTSRIPRLVPRGCDKPSRHHLIPLLHRP